MKSGWLPDSGSIFIVIGGMDMIQDIHAGTIPNMEVLSGKWKLDLLYRLTSGCVRWSILTHSIPDAAPNVLTRQLRYLENDGLVRRIVTAAHPPQVIEYTLSDQGQRLIPLLHELERWDAAYGKADRDAPDFSTCQRVISSRWMLSILSLLSTPLRFGSILEHIGNLSRGVLAAQLGDLRDMGLVSQKRYEVFPPRVEYSLSEKGRGLLEILLPGAIIQSAKNA